MTALLQALPQVGQALGLGAVFWTIFAIFGVTLLKGSLYACNDKTVLLETECAGTFHPFMNATHTTNVSRSWMRNELNWDSYPQSMFTLFVVAIGERWADVMFDAIDATGIGTGPIRDNNPWLALFFILFVIVGNFLTLNILMGVLITFFLRAKRARDGTMLLTKDQRTYLLVKKIIDATLFGYEPPVPRNCARRVLYAVVSATVTDIVAFFKRKQTQSAHERKEKREKSKRHSTGHVAHLVVHELPVFEIFGAVATVSVAFALGCSGLNGVNEEVIDHIFIGFIGFLVLEAVMKMIAFSVLDYFLIRANRFDFFVLVLVLLSFGVPSITPYARVVVLLRTLRVAALLQFNVSAQKLFALVIHSSATLLAVLTLLVFLFAVAGAIGVQLFANAVVEDGTPLGSLVNFRYLHHAMLLVYVALTTEGWFDTAQAAAQPAASCPYCSPMFAYGYFVAFVIIGSIVFLQLCAVVVVEHFDDLDDCAEKRIVAAFAEVKSQWREVAPRGRISGGLGLERLIRLVVRLPRRVTALPVGATPHDVFALLRRLPLQIGSDLKIHFQPLCHALLVHAFNLDSTSVKTHATVMHGELPDPNCFTVAHLMAARLIWARWKAFLAEKQVLQEEAVEASIHPTDRL